jgi:hypothetical protein
MFIRFQEYIVKDKYGRMPEGMISGLGASQNYTITVYNQQYTENQ